jgi:hypothetical protein
VKPGVFVLWASYFVCHSTFGFRHFPTYDAGAVSND